MESAEYDQGRIVADASGYNGYRVLVHIPDHLGNVRVVADEECNVLERNGYYPFGLRWSVGSDLESNRYRFNGKEEQTVFGIPYIDYEARQYDPILARWSAPDPLAEKYYGISPYAFCANDPVNLVERDGRAWDVVWDVASVGFGIHNLVKNLQSGNVDAAIDDGVGIAVDLVSAFIPFVPGGVGAVRAGAKAVNAIDNVADATKTTKTISETANHVQGAAKAFNGQADTYSETARKAFHNAKDQNGVPKSQQPDRTIKPNTEAGNAAGLRDDNVVQYEFTNFKGEKVIIRQDKTTIYPDGGVQPPHYNAGKSSDNKLGTVTK